MKNYKIQFPNEQILLTSAIIIAKYDLGSLFLQGGVHIRRFCFNSYRTVKASSMASTFLIVEQIR